LCKSAFSYEHKTINDIIQKEMQRRQIKLFILEKQLEKQTQTNDNMNNFRLNNCSPWCTIAHQPWTTDVSQWS